MNDPPQETPSTWLKRLRATFPGTDGGLAPEAVPELIDALASVASELRYSRSEGDLYGGDEWWTEHKAALAAAALGKLGEHAVSAVPALVARANTPVAEIESACLQALVAVMPFVAKDVAARALKDVIQRISNEGRYWLLRAFRDLDPVVVLPATLVVATGRVEEHRAAAIASLATIGDTATVLPVLVAGSRENDERVRYWATRALAARGCTDIVVPLLLDELDSPDVPERPIEDVARFPSIADRAVPRLVRLLHRENMRPTNAASRARTVDHRRRLLLEALAALAPSAAPSLVLLARDAVAGVVSTLDESVDREADLLTFAQSVLATLEERARA